MHKGKLVVSGVVFLLVALLHLYRIISPFPVLFGTFVVPEAFSYFGFIFFGLLALWDLWGSCCKCCCCGNCGCSTGCSTKTHNHDKK